MKKQVIQVLVAQCALTLILVSVLALTGSDEIAFSGLVGCLTGLVPNAYVLRRMLRQADNVSAEEFVSYAYRSQIGKWIMTGMMFVLIFTAEYVWDPVGLFAGFCLITLSSGFVPIFVKGD